MKKFISLLLLGLSINLSPTVQAQGVLPAFQCTLTDKLDLFNWPGTRRESFVTTTPVIYFICSSDNVRTGDRIKAVWIADHTSTTHPKIYTLAVLANRIHRTQSDGEDYEADLSLIKPPCGWVRGDYHVQLYINDIEGYSYKFRIR